MADELLLDTGAFVALVDRSERRHADCVAVLEAWHGTIFTTEAVLTMAGVALLAWAHVRNLRLSA